MTVGQVTVEHILRVFFSVVFCYVHISMDYLHMDEKRGHVMCGNQLAIER